MQQDAFDQAQRAFMTYPSIACDEELDIRLDAIIVHIQCRDNMKKPRAGAANTNNEIWVVGRCSDKGIILNQMILGHELQHLLNFEDRRIADPDETHG